MDRTEYSESMMAERLLHSCMERVEFTHDVLRSQLSIEINLVLSVYHETICLGS